MDAKEIRRKQAKETGTRIKELREKKELTQKQLATCVGIGQQSIAEIESGQTLDPKSIDTIAKVLGVSTSWLRYGKDDDVSPRSRYVAERLDVLPEGDRKFIEQLVETVHEIRSSKAEIDALRQTVTLLKKAKTDRENP